MSETAEVVKRFSSDAPEPTPVSLEVGKWYERRDGMRTRIVKKEARLNGTDYHDSAGFSYTCAGFYDPRMVTQYDLLRHVSEYDDEIEDTPDTSAPTAKETAHDPVNHPPHYTAHPSGIECIQITEHMDFCLGNAMKYLWRAGQKDGHPTVQELRKAIWYIERKIAQLEPKPA